MLKKLMIAVSLLVLGVFAAEAKDLVLLDLNFLGEGSIKLESKLPPGVFANASRMTKSGRKAYPYYIDLGKTLSLELKVRIVGGDGQLSPSLYAFRKEKGQKGQAISITCKNFEFNDEECNRVPCVISKWQSMMSRNVHDGDVITIKVEFEKPEE